MKTISSNTIDVNIWNTQAPELTALDASRSLQWTVIPLDDDKKPVKTGGNHPDGNPKRLGWKPYQERLSTEREIRAWQKKYNPPAWAIITGKKSNIVVLDFDGEQGEETRRTLGLSPHVRTGSGGSHVYFKHPGWAVSTLNSKSKKALGERWPGLDIRADGGYAAFCGRNTSGAYEWLREPVPDDLSILPDELRIFLGLMNPPDIRSNSSDLQDILIDKALGMEGRDNAGFWLACQLRDNRFSQSEAESVLLAYARRVPTTNTKGQYEPFTDEEARTKVRSAYSASARQAWESPRYNPSRHSASNGNGNGNHQQPIDEQPGSFNRTDLGNAERFATRYRDRVRWCEVWNSWIVFNGKAWEQDKTGQADRLAKATVRSIYGEAEAIIDDTSEGKAERQRLAKHAVASESNRAVRAMLDRAKSELPATPDQFNTHLHLLNCKNGTLDLLTGELRPHNPADMLTRCLKISYNPLAPCPKWLQFIQSIFAGDISLIDFLQQALGMSLSGDVSEQCLFICHGAGSNGKTTLLEAVRIILAAYGLAANIETFQVHKGERIMNDVAELYGARFVTASENALGSRLNEAFIKKATGNEPLRARRLHENEFQFMPECTLWFAVNHKPVVKDTTKGMWRRVHFIPFTVTIEGDQVDKHLGKKLLEESEGILAWLVQGCITWYRQARLNAPKIVQEATQAYRAEMDVVARFLDECCEIAINQEIGATKLYKAYKAWCDETGERWETQKNFGSWLTERGYERVKQRSGWFYRGLSVTDVTDVTDNSDNSTREENTSQKSGNNGSHQSHQSPFHVGQRVITPKGEGTVKRIDPQDRRVTVGFSPGLSVSYPFEQVTEVQG